MAEAKNMYQATRILDETVYVHCLLCKWRSKALSAEGAVKSDDLAKLTDWQKGYLAGAYSNHGCSKKNRVPGVYHSVCQCPDCKMARFGNM